MSRIQTTFQALNGAKALIPYITVGDPNLDTTLALMHSMVANGADIIELGVPFSDPMADGPTIQRAAERALQQNVSLQNVLNVVREFRTQNSHTPVVLMGYLNPVHKMGYETFARAAAAAGVDGVLTVDSPVETIAPLHEALKQQGIFQGVQIGDFQCIGHQRACSRAPTRAHWATVLFGPINEVLNDEKIARETHLHNGIELIIQALLVFWIALSTLSFIGIQNCHTLGQTLV